MLETSDPRGWLHIYDEDLLRAFGGARRLPHDLLQRRPVLALASANDPRLRAALHAEVQFWHELDRARLRIYDRAVRPYRAAVKKSHLPPSSSLALQHEMRLRCAEAHLPLNPLLDYGVDRMIADARGAVEQIVNPAALAWLPDVREHFRFSAA